jgi:hypothetical protein
MQQGARIPKSDLIDELNARLSRMQFIAGNIMKVISEDAQLRAFGAPGVSGDPDMIEHMAKRLIDLYEAILDWQSEVLALRLHAESTIPAIGASMARQPITAIRDFSYEFAANLEAGIARAVADPDSKVEISMTLTFLLDDGLVDQWIAEVKRLMAI